MKTAAQNLDFLSISFFILFSCLISSCSGGKTSEQTATEKQVGKLERIETPASLQSKPEIVTFFKELETLTDEFAHLVGKATVVNTREFKGQNVSQLCLAKQIKHSKMTSEVSYRSQQITTKWKELTDKGLLLKKGLSQEEAKAFDAVFNLFQKRMKEIEDKCKSEGLDANK